jgi:peptidoglycan/LPS O-acetylase OafA/YrhL
MGHSKTSERHVHALDGIRGLATLTVMFAHFAPARADFETVIGQIAGVEQDAGGAAIQEKHRHT